MILSILIMILFIIPVFTGQVVNIGNVTGFLCGLFLYLLSHDPSLLSRTDVRILLFILGLCVLISLPITYHMIRALRKKPQGHETLIILGCEIMGEKPSLMQVERLQAAYRYLSENPKTSVICSGGQGKNEKVSEALAMKRWLCQKGIDETRIHLEDTSETTEENIRFSKQVIAKNHLDSDIALCTNEFHICRAGLIAKNEGLDYTAVSAPTAWWLFSTFYVRELYAVLYYLVKSEISKKR